MLDNTTPREQYHVLYNILCHKSDNLAKVTESFPPNVPFRWNIFSPRLASWHALLQFGFSQFDAGVECVSVESNRGYFFSVDSMYKALIQPIMPAFNNKMIWKMKIPLKTKVFTWYLRGGIILTKDNLVKRKWYSKTCVFCHQYETTKHLFFKCRFARSKWSIIQIMST
jgi:hypothetical protein